MMVVGGLVTDMVVGGLVTDGGCGWSSDRCL